MRVCRGQSRIVTDPHVYRNARTDAYIRACTYLKSAVILIVYTLIYMLPQPHSVV